ncbi:hypothetical protein [Streptomyces melanogenes]|uniref:Toxin co-regulated pilus biosynthesis protein Q C-terminal domain-containing protein n=1 Tax=Streptomyces melanogenes TaxID=67326 RepID=A0ABZ1XE11_9ACTN|nr:hypothetical protein [Streptomyces melanogenes]
MDGQDVFFRLTGMIHNPHVDLSDDGPALDDRWSESDNNLCGGLPDSRDTSQVAERFVRAGWRSRSSSWEGYELETSWCRVEADPVDGSATLLNGVVDPDRLDDLAALLTRFGLRFTLELYDEGGDLVREIKG